MSGDRKPLPPRACGQALTDSQISTETASAQRFVQVVVTNRVAVLIKQVAASSLEEGMAGDYVVRRYGVERNSRNAVASGHPGEAISDAGHRAEACW